MQTFKFQPAVVPTCHGGRFLRSLWAASLAGLLTLGTTQAEPALKPARLYALAGQGTLGAKVNQELLQREYAAGVRGRLLELGWNVLQPGGPTDWDTNRVATYQKRIETFLSTGPDTVLILDLGMQYPPDWAVDTDPLTDQYGNVLVAHQPAGSNSVPRVWRRPRPVANVFWSPTVRVYASNYLCKVFTSLDFHGRLWAVRVGPVTGEMMYPNSCTASDGPKEAGPDGGQSFWAFDAAAQRQAPAAIRGWRPGQASPQCEAQLFYDWYVSNLDDTFGFLSGEIRKYFAGYLAPVTPGAGVIEADVKHLISRNLVARDKRYYGTGNYWQLLFKRFRPADRMILNWCSSFGDGSGSDDAGTNLARWSAAHRMSSYAAQAGRRLFAENPGGNAYTAGQCRAAFNTTMQWDFEALKKYNCIGLMWIRESEMFHPCHASLANYQALIQSNP